MLLPNRPSSTSRMIVMIDLMAHLVDYEGCSNVLARSEADKTLTLSDGYDKRSNLDASIHAVQSIQAGF
jgi:hypothetical protein